MKLYLKLDGTTIMGHDYYLHDDYTEEIDIPKKFRLTNLGSYKYKYDNGLIELTQQEIDEHPLKIEQENRTLALKNLKESIKNAKADGTITATEVKNIVIDIVKYLRATQLGG